MHLPITERDQLVRAALRLVQADLYGSDAWAHADDEADYAADGLAAAARALVTALDARPDGEGEAPGEPAAVVLDSPREKLAKGLRDLAQFLTDRPGVPIPDFPELTIYPPKGTDAQERAYVDAIAAVMGVKSTVFGGTHYQAARRFGPLSYKILAIAAQEMADYEERSRLGNEAFKARQAAGAPAAV